MAIDFDTLIVEAEGRLEAISREAMALHAQLADMEAEVHRLEGEHRLLKKLQAEAEAGKEPAPDVLEEA